MRQMLIPHFMHSVHTCYCFCIKMSNEGRNAQAKVNSKCFLPAGDEPVLEEFCLYL